MQELIQHAVPGRLRYSAAALIVLATTFTLGVDAQAQTKRGSTAGAPSGAVGGGSTGASNRGGAGGVGNPSPGGGPATAGEPGSNNGPQGTETSRPGYLGGRNTETVNPPPANTITINSVTVAQFGRCPMPGGALSAEARMSGDNVGRIETVSRHLTRGPKKDDAADARYLLADLQEELQKAKPDLTLAGTYLGIVAKTAITPSLAADIGESLCSPMSASAADQVAKIAEAQRRKIAQER